MKKPKEEKCGENHHACKEMIEKYGKDTPCCACTRHECKPSVSEMFEGSNSSLRKTYEKAVEEECTCIPIHLKGCPKFKVNDTFPILPSESEKKCEDCRNSTSGRCDWHTQKFGLTKIEEKKFYDKVLKNELLSPTSDWEKVEKEFESLLRDFLVQQLAWEKSEQKDVLRGSPVLQEIAEKKYNALKSFIRESLENARRGQKEEMVKGIQNLINISNENSPQEWYDGLRCAKSFVENFTILRENK